MSGDIVQSLGGSEKLLGVYKSALTWISNSFKANNNLGSSGKSNVLGQFDKPYPETTGYLIPTLIDASKILDKKDYLQLALKQLDFFDSIQNSDGSFQQSIDNKKPIVFDTAQILIGFISLHQSGTVNLLDKINDIRTWLYSRLDENGLFKSDHYFENYYPSYYSRVIWPMLLADQVLDIPFPDKSAKAINYLQSLQNNNLSFADWSFDGRDDAFTHTIIYTLRGLWECACLLGMSELESTVVKSVSYLDQLILSEGGFAGSYDSSWKGDRSFICSAGHAQLFLLMEKIKAKSDIHFDSQTKLISILIGNQSVKGKNKGGISASIPIWGKYQRWYYTNWTQKFFCDAIAKLLILN